MFGALCNKCSFQVEEARMLDNMQKAVLSCGVEYARALVICRTSKVPPDFYSGYAEAGSADHLLSLIHI